MTIHDTRMPIWTASMHDPVDDDRIVAELLREIKETRASILKADAEMRADIKANRDGLNDLYKRLNRPGTGSIGDGANEHALAVEYLANRQALKGQLVASTRP